MTASRNQARHGAVLIIVAGLAAVLASLGLGFVLRMRSDAEEGRWLVQETQARLMLNAALQYVQETARLGWDDPSTPEPEEAFGWIDIRDGRLGPCGPLGQRLFSLGAYPDVGRTARCPLAVMRRPPFAISQDFNRNPMVLDASLGWSDILSVRNRDPLPAIIDPIAFAVGDRAPRFIGLGWFRIHRLTPARFVITCGAGATAGLRDWNEVQLVGAEAQFGTREVFDEARRGEPVMWFATEWSAAVGYNALYHYRADSDPIGFRLNEVGHPAIGDNERPNSRQFAGTFSYIQRLRDEPAAW